jgi:hypothetical protein
VIPKTTKNIKVLLLSIGIFFTLAGLCTSITLAVNSLVSKPSSQLSAGDAGCDTGFRLFENDQYSLCIPQRFQLASGVKNNDRSLQFTAGEQEIIISTEYTGTSVWRKDFECYIKVQDAMISGIASKRTMYKEVNVEKSECLDYYRFETITEEMAFNNGKSSMMISMRSKDNKGIFKDENEFVRIEQSLRLQGKN